MRVLKADVFPPEPWEIPTFISHTCCLPTSLLIVNTQLKYDLLSFFSMECPQEAPAHRASVDAVQGGDGGLGAAHHAQVMRRTIYLF